ncbi:MAG: poly(R)-hydroxyalkanoic acid synthase subunit PhaE [Thermodesulfobacteriota bacterium]
METKETETGDMSALFSQWINQAAQTWQQMLQTGADPAANSTGPTEDDSSSDDDPHRMHRDTMFDNWQTLAKCMGQPEALSSLFSDMSKRPEVLSALVQTGWQAFHQLQQQGADPLDITNRFADTRHLFRPDEKDVNRWIDFYDKEFRKLIHMPQMGLTPLHQEKINCSLERFNEMQRETTRFILLLWGPVEEATRQMQEQILHWAAAGKMPSDSKALYKQWIKILENRYTQMFQSRSYLQTMQKAISANQQYQAARKDFLESVLQYFGVPTNRDIDDVYRELYRLKKRVKTLEKQVSDAAPKNRAAAAAG